MEKEILFPPAHVTPWIVPKETRRMRCLGFAAKDRKPVAAAECTRSAYAKGETEGGHDYGSNFAG